MKTNHTLGLLAILAWGGLGACSEKAADPAAGLVEIAEIPVGFHGIEATDENIVLGPVELSQFKLVEVGKTADTGKGPAVAAQGIYWKLEYTATNLLDHPTYVVPMLELQDERKVGHPCVLSSCDAASTEALPAGASRTETAFFDIPKAHRPITLVAHGARAVGKAVAGVWSTGVEAPKRRARHGAKKGGAVAEENAAEGAAEPVESGGSGSAAGDVGEAAAAVAPAVEGEAERQPSGGVEAIVPVSHAPEEVDAQGGEPQGRPSSRRGTPEVKIDGSPEAPQ